MREKARFGVAMVAALAFVGTACSRNQSTRVSLPHRLLPSTPRPNRAQVELKP